MAGYPGCNWCYGAGCLACNAERRKREEQMYQPIFTARRDNPKDMERLRRVAGADVVTEAFGPGGRGIRQIEENAAIESLLQAIDKHFEDADANESTEGRE